MKHLDFYSKILNCNNENEVFQYLINNLKPTNRTWSYFINWDKVFENTKKIEISLNILNYLIGKDDFDNEFKFLVKENPEVIKALPALSVRDGSNRTKFKILIDYANKKIVYEDYDFNNQNPTAEDIDKYLKFVTKTGIKDLIVSQKIKSLVDYMIGVEAGLDSNGRKNRGGHIMEDIVEAFVIDTCRKNKFNYQKEANAASIKKMFYYVVPVDKSSRRYDFVIDNGKELFLIETNFYGGGGSKLKSTAGEYRNLFNILNGKFKFIWITDGNGWRTTINPLRETFNNNDYLFNLAMLENGILNIVLNL